MNEKKNNPLISIVIPTFNEVENIGTLISRMKTSLQNIPYEVIIVDDNSPDGTGEIAEDLAKEYPITVIHRKSRLGLASGVLKGFEHSRGKILCCMDADLSHPPETIPELVDAIDKEDFDLVIASRLIHGGAVVGAWPQHRKLTSYVATFLAKPLTSVNDTMSGFFALKNEVIQNVNLVPRGYKIGLEILVKGNYKKVKEVPFAFDNRKNGASKLNLKIQIEYLIQIVDLFCYRLIKLVQNQFIARLRMLVSNK